MPLYLLTAPIGAGKSTFCQLLTSQLRANGWQVGGILCPAIFENGKKTGIQVLALTSGETRLLARDENAQPPFAPATPVLVGHWIFDGQVLEWGNDLLAAQQACDFLLVDELGVLEFQRKTGWMNAFECLRNGEYRVGLVVIRPWLVEQACAMLPIQQVIALQEDTPIAQQVAAFVAEYCAIG